MAREFDAVIFGATGFTGRNVVAHFGQHKVCPRWAVAGRRKEALEELQQEFGVPSLVVADTGDMASLVAMARRTRLVLNATGPYRFLGEPVVQACIEGGADYIDLCGEPEFMERTLLKYQDAAQKAGVYCCSACAFDSIPADMGILRCAQIFQEAGGECAHVELFHTIECPEGYSGHVTTFQAAVHGMGSAADLKKVRAELDAKYGKVPKGSTAMGDLPRRSGSWFTEARLGSYAMPFIGSDASVVRSSRRMWSNVLQQADAQKLMPQFGIYFTVQSNLSLAKFICGGLTFQTLAKYEWGRNLLLRFPETVTFGGFSEDGPTEEQMNNNRWVGTFFAEGLVGGAERKVTVRATLDDPGYIGTSAMFAAVAETILCDRNSLAIAGTGGVFTPAALFRKSSLFQRLARKGLEFAVVESDLGR